MNIETQEGLKEIGKSAYESIAEMVAALRCDYDRLEELREEKPQWVAGCNISGYLPDTDPALFVDFDDAKNYIVEEIRTSAEQREQREEDGDDKHLAITELADAFEASSEQELSQQCADGYTYWINKINDDPAILASWEDFEEYRGLVEAAGDCESEDEARQRIEEDALSVKVRSGWTTPGETLEAEEFCILLSTGGPASRIRGELNEHKEPRRAWLEVQDWGTPWTQFFGADQDVLLAYASCFYFGE